MSHLVRELLRQAAGRIEMRDARILLAFQMDVEPDRMTLLMGDSVSDGVAVGFEALVAARVAGRPVSHLIGRRAFFGRDFEVSSDVLDPRPETEELVAAALSEPWERVLDLGTGSGCILVSLLSERDGATGIGVDASSAALAVAQRNADALGVASRCDLAVSDWFAGVRDHFDLIVSNPPYIAEDEMAGLAPELSYEPRMALTDEGDGLSCYRIIAAGAPAHLNAGGWLMVEIGPTQGAAVAEMFGAAGLVQVGIRPDLDGRDRVVVGQMPL